MLQVLLVKRLNLSFNFDFFLFILPPNLTCLVLVKFSSNGATQIELVVRLFKFLGHPFIEIH